MSADLLNILEKLISFQSVTPKGRDCLEFVGQYLSDLGFEYIIEDFGPNNDVSNLYAYYGPKHSKICFGGHVDVVPPGDLSSWSHDPFAMSVDGEKIYGRGIVDMKGAVACALSAIKQLIQKHKNLDGGISFLLTTDEEGPGTYGLQAMLPFLQKNGFSFNFCLLGEPTSEAKLGGIIKIGRRGSINFELTVNGQQGHVAYPHLAKNPMPIMTMIMQELQETKLDQGNVYFQPSNLEIVSINTDNKTTNVIPGSVGCKFNIRFNNLHEPKSLEKIVHHVARKYSDDYKLQSTCSSLPFLQEISPNMQQAKKIVEQVCQVKSKFSTSGGTSDARFIHKYADVIELGLKSDMAHKINENCQISDLQMLRDVYIMLIAQLLSL